MAIHIPCDAQHRPVPTGDRKENGLPEGELPEGQERPPWGASGFALLAMTVVVGTRSLCAEVQHFGYIVLRNGRNRSLHALISSPNSFNKSFTLFDKNRI